MNAKNASSPIKPEGLPKNPPPLFPMFVNLAGKRVTVIGGGAAASKRIKTLIKFGAEIHVISPEIAPELAVLVRDNKASWLKMKFAPELLEGSDLVIAATNARDVNRQVGQAAKRMKMLVHVSDSREESSFGFPTIVQNEGIVAGILASDDDYSALKSVVRKIYKRFLGR